MKKPIILVLSDIHFKDKPKRGLPKDQRNISFFQTIVDEINKINPTHIVINGDMVFSAKKKQYYDCYETIFEPYLTANKNARLILIPGNHSCQRTIPHIIVDEKVIRPSKKFNLSDYKGKSEFEEWITTEINEEPSKTKVLKHLATKRLGIDYESYLNESKDLDFFNLLFHNYRSFVDDIVIPRFEEINEEKVLITYDAYRESSGLHGVIYDSEYNIAFACLNSVNYAWGKETFESLYNKKKSDVYINEYGNLSLCNSTEVVYNELDALNQKNLLNHTVTFLFSHVPFSWLSYESRYKPNSSFKYVLDLSDIACFGHIHVPHFPPTTYRERTYFFDLPQLNDFRSNLLEDDKLNSVINTYGFSVFEVFEDLNHFNHNKYKFEAKNEFTKNALGKYDLKWEKGKPVPYKYLKAKHPITTCVDCLKFEISSTEDLTIDFLSEDCGFRKYIDGKAIASKIGDSTIQLTNDIYINFKELSKAFYNQYPVLDKSRQLKFVKHNNILEFFVVLNSKTSKIDIANMLYESFCKIDKQLINDVNNININFLDYSLFYIFGDDLTYQMNKSSSEWDTIYQKWRFMLERLINNLKVMLFSLSVESATVAHSGALCDNNIHLLSDIGIGFDIITLTTYKNYLIKKQLP